MYGSLSYLISVTTCQYLYNELGPNFPSEGVLTIRRTVLNTTSCCFVTFATLCTQDLTLLVLVFASHYDC